MTVSPAALTGPISTRRPVGPESTKYLRTRDAAVRTNNYVFHQLIPYIGNKRKLLPLIRRALGRTSLQKGSTFVDLFAGSGVVGRMAKTLGFRVIANDWEPYSRVLSSCYIGQNKTPPFVRVGGYLEALRILNNLPPRVDWVTEHLCPSDDVHFDTAKERMFYLRRNGMRIDAIRQKISEWRINGLIDQVEEDCLLAPLVYQACYTSNTSGVFKGFHRGWGGQTGTALYRIASELTLSPAIFLDNGFSNEVYCEDAQVIAESTAPETADVVYLDPPYNQHPYGSNYHVLNSVVLWDRPEVSKTIGHGSKSAIRMDWRSERRSPYNHRGVASRAYCRLLDTLDARFILTSYSTDGTIPLDDLLSANVGRGHVSLELEGYKRYRVSSQRYSEKPMNVEFVIVTDTRRKSDRSVDNLKDAISAKERAVLRHHAESTEARQCLISDFDELSHPNGEEGPASDPARGSRTE
jgi:adenine-specific DNA-methyltransferase